MQLTEEQLHAFCISGIHFPSNFPELARLEIFDVTMPKLIESLQPPSNCSCDEGDQANQRDQGDQGEQEDPGEQEDQGAQRGDDSECRNGGSSDAREGVLSVLRVTEVNHPGICRIILLSDVQALFLPNTSKKKQITLGNGIWIVKGRVTCDNLQCAQKKVCKGNVHRLGIAFVARSAHIWNCLNISTTAAGSRELERRIRRRRGRRYYDPCCS